MKFPRQITTTVTLYNVIPQQGRTPERLQKTVLGGVFWDISHNAAYGKNTQTEQDTATLMIPNYSAYMPPTEFKSEGFPAARFTFSPGDIIVKGEGADAASAAELSELYDDCIVITTVRDCRYGSPAMQHWEVSGK